MTDYTWPDSLAPTAQSYWLQPHVGRSESPFTRQQKIYGLSRPRWVCRMLVRGGIAGAGLRGKGAAVDAFLVKLEGGLNRVLMYDFRRPRPSGDLPSARYDEGEGFDGGESFLDTLALGTNAAAAAGATQLALSGCTPSLMLFRAGDYVGGDGRPHSVTDDVESDAAGNATVRFKPALETAIAEGAAVYWKVRGAFRLTSDDAGSAMTEVGQAEQFDIEMVEDL